MRMRMRTVASITTTPARVGRCQVALRSLVASGLFDAVYLNTSFLVDKEHLDLGDLASAVTCTLTEEDFGPATKVLPTLWREAGPETVIFYGDDDHKYSRKMLVKLVRTARKNPQAVVCGLVHEYAGPLAAGHGGVALTRGSIDSAHLATLENMVSAHAAAEKPCRFADDLLLTHFYTRHCGLSIIPAENYEFDHSQTLPWGETSGLHVERNFAREYATCLTALEKTNTATPTNATRVSQDSRF